MLQKIGIAIAAAIGSFVAVVFVKPFGGESFDYTTASIEEKQKYLEGRANNITRGFNLTKGSASEISQVYVDAAYDLVSISVQLKDPKTDNAGGSDVESYRLLMLKNMCKLTGKKMLTETDYTLRMRFFKRNGAKLMTVEASGETCARYFS